MGSEIGDRRVQGDCGPHRGARDDLRHTIDYHTTTDRPTDRERQAVDAVLGSPESVWSGAEVRSDVDDHVAYGGYALAHDRRHLLLPVLEAIQSAIGYVSHGALNYVAERIPVSPAEAFGVADFYELISTQPRPPRVAHVCDDIGCRARGVEDVIDELSATFGPEGAQVGEAMWLRSPCLGQCDKGSATYIQVAGASNVVIAPSSAARIADALSAPAPAPEVAPTPPTPGTMLLSGAPATLDEYRADGGYMALRKALSLPREAVVDEVVASGLKGRGGAAFPAGVKWRAVAEAAGTVYVVCNADESEPGTFKDRVLMESNPYRLVEALTIAGYAVGANLGFFYVRGEYPMARTRLADAIAEARMTGFLGVDIAGSEFSFDIELRCGAGAYVCGEETALFNSIEGFRGEPRQKPPFPTEAGLFGRPTVVNNVETLASVPSIVHDGGEAFAAIGTAGSTGPKLFCVSGSVGTPGVYEVPFGATTRQLIDLAGGVVGTLGAVLVGGAAGGFVTEDQLDVPLTFEDTRAAGMTLGSGVVMVFDATIDVLSITRRIARFFADESCGLCIPCRVGTVRQEESLERLEEATGDRDEMALLAELDTVLKDASICGLGQFATSAVQSAIRIGLIGGAR